MLRAAGSIVIAWILCVRLISSHCLYTTGNVVEGGVAGRVWWDFGGGCVNVVYNQDSVLHLVFGCHTTRGSWRMHECVGRITHVATICTATIHWPCTGTNGCARDYAGIGAESLDGAPLLFFNSDV